MAAIVESVAMTHCRTAPQRRTIRAWLQCAAFVAALLLPSVSASVSAPSAPAGIPQGVWLMDGDVAVEIYNCTGLLCGRIVWLRKPRNSAGQLDRDKRNPEPSLRQRELCGLTILSGLQPDGPGRWRGGSFYNPHDGKSYSVTAELQSADVLVARVYRGIPFFGKTKTLTRVPRLSSDGWC